MRSSATTARGQRLALGVLFAGLIHGATGCSDSASETTAGQGGSSVAGATARGSGGNQAPSGAATGMTGGEAAVTGGTGAASGGEAAVTGGTTSTTGGESATTGGTTAASGGEAAVTGGTTGTTGGTSGTTGGDGGATGGTQASTGGSGGQSAGAGGQPGGSGGTGGDVSGGSGGATGGTAGGVAGTYYLSDLCELADPINAWGPFERDLSNGEDAEGDGGPLTIAAAVYSKGLGMHAPADVGFALGGLCSSFSALVGVDDEMKSAGSVIFEVWGDGALLYQSSLITGADGATAVDVDVTGVQELRLVASEDAGNGSDHADWAEARVECSAQPTDSCQRDAEEIVVPAGYQLVWSDEFNVEGPPDPENWGFEEGFVRNEELQLYQPDNAWVQAGFLIIEGRRETVANPGYTGSGDWKTSRQYAEYTSSSLRSMGKQSWQYGRFELRARLVAQAGLWPAWWTLGNSGEWPSCGEIDIMEYYNNRVHANVASGTTERWVAQWDSASREVSSFGDDDWDAKFHIWRMDWDDQTISLYLDGEQLNTTNLNDMLNPGGDSPFRQPHYMLINLAIGGTAGGDPSGTEFPTHYEVDYVRVFQRQ